jgi:hypothetical protein
MMLAASLGPVGRVGARLVPPKTARTAALSNTARLQSMPSAACRPSRQARWMHSQTPCSCQSRSRRQQVMPLPQFISLGRSSQGMPVFSTNRMPVRTCRSGILGLPPLGFGGSGGSNGSTSSHSSSDTGIWPWGFPHSVVSSILKLVKRFC